MPYELELQVALEAAHKAGEYLKEEYHKFKVIPDAPADISTHADRQSQEIILHHLHEAFPNDGLRAEEKTAMLAQVGETGSRLWIVDPIDGTRGFARKNGEFSVMVALAVEGKAVVGVVLEPALERLTYARAGAGCWMHDANGAPVQCKVSQVERLRDALLVVSHSRNLANPPPAVKALNPARIRETYSAGIKLALVARGEADLYLSTYDGSRDWDICAGEILVAEAGGLVTNLNGEAPVYGLPSASLRNGLLAGNAKLHAAGLGALAVIS